MLNCILGLVVVGLVVANFIFWVNEHILFKKTLQSIDDYVALKLGRKTFGHSYTTPIGNESTATVHQATHHFIFSMEDVND